MDFLGRLSSGRLLGAALAGLALLLGHGAPAAAQPAVVPASFEERSLPLAEALERFGRRAEYDIIVADVLIRTKRSAAVGATRSPHVALGQLLRGTGLVPRFTRPNALILEPAAVARAPDMRLDPLNVMPIAAPRARQYQWYGQELLQASLRTLAQSQVLGARSFDLVVYFWIDPVGRVTQLKVQGEPDQSETSRLASELLQDLIVSSSPPDDMPQPVGLRIAAH